MTERTAEDAAEVERLKAENRQLENEIADMALGPTMVQNQRAEVERLKAFHEAWVETQVANATGSPEIMKNKREKLLSLHRAIRGEP